MEKIQDYAVIGNGRSAALISKKGSIDWLAWPRFDSPSFFCKILDEDKGGFWSIDCEAIKIERSYIENTNILETIFITETGSIKVTDFMTAFSEKEKSQSLQPEHELIREIQCLNGTVSLTSRFSPRLHFGKKIPKIHDKGNLGFRIEDGKHLFTLRGDQPSKLIDSSLLFTMHLKTEEKAYFSLSYTIEGPAVIPTFDSQKIEMSSHFWQTWAQQCTYKGVYKKEVTRSALALKLLNFSPSGAFIAAPTTSLPERLGGDLNWDYRFCWLRDASFTVHALFGIGFKKEAEAFVSWLLHATRLTLPELRVLYTVYGEKSEKEKILDHLTGYKNSYPVRVGNGASDQKQLDIYGEVLDAVHRFYFEGGTLDHETKKMITSIAKFVAKHWQENDYGIWEDRSETKPYTHSRLMSWVALDRMLSMNKKESFLSSSWVKRFSSQKKKLEESLKKEAWNSSLETYTATLHGQMVDVSLLLFSFYDFEEAKTIRMEKTYTKIKEQLYKGDGLIYRWEKSISAKEGAFAMCGFWLVTFLTKMGEKEKAREIFEQLVKKANDLGLYSEEIDVTTNDFLGNFPQAFTHVGLINAALALELDHD